MCVLRQRKVIDDCIAVDIMRDGLIVEAAPQLPELEKFGHLGPRCVAAAVQPVCTSTICAPSMSTKKAPGAGSPIVKRCAFVGHLTNAENTAAEIWLLAS
jgi:hypothetical protein